MDTKQVGRRGFLAGTALGAGVAALGKLGGLDRAWADSSQAGTEGAAADTREVQMYGQVQPDISTTVSSVSKPPPAPVKAQGFLSRPDFNPPGINLEKTSAFNSSYPGYFFLTPRAVPGGPTPYPKEARPGLMIMDTDGHLVWWSPLNPTNPNPFNFRVQTYKGKKVLTWFRAASTSAPGSYVIADSTYTPIQHVSAINPGGLSNFRSDIHEFVITGQNTALVTANSQGTVSGQAATIGHAQEIDIASSKLLWNWNSNTQVGIGSSYIDTQVSSSNPHPDYFHINSIALWPGTRNYLISSRNTCAVYLVDAKTKEILWRLGGKYSAWKLGQGVPFWWQHDARPLANGTGISIFDNASQPNAGHELYASGKVINLSKGHATIRHRLFHYDGYAAASTQGNNTLLPNGSRIVGFGALNYFSVFALSNAQQPPMILDARYPAGVDSYRVFLNDWVGNPPQSEIGFAVYQNAGSGHWTGHASWNGATEIATWRLYYGPSRSSLPYHSTAHKRAGFETSIPINTSLNPKYFQAVAYNSAGDELGRSNIKQVAN